MSGSTLPYEEETLDHEARCRHSVRREYAHTGCPEIPTRAERPPPLNHNHVPAAAKSMKTSDHRSSYPSVLYVETEDSLSLKLVGPLRLVDHATNATA